MLEIIYIRDDGLEENIEISKGVDWKFCVLSGCYRDSEPEACFVDGTFVVTNKWLTFRAFDDTNTRYEVSLRAVEEGRIRFEVPYRKSLYQDSPLKEYENENRGIDMVAFLKTNPADRITICERVVEPEGEVPYTETLQMEIDRNSDRLRFYLTVTYRFPKLANVRKIMSYRKEECRIKDLTLDNEIKFDFENHAFMEVMQKILNYCEKRELPLSIRCVNYMLPGHCIDIPNTVIKTADFEIAFEFGTVKMVHITKDIMNGTCYTDTTGGVYNIGTIVEEIRKETEGGRYLDNHGPENICKRVYAQDEEYIFGCWFL